MKEESYSNEFKKVGNNLTVTTRYRFSEKLSTTYVAVNLNELNLMVNAVNENKEEVWEVDFVAKGLSFKRFLDEKEYEMLKYVLSGTHF